VAPAVAGQPWAGGDATCTTGLWLNGAETYAYGWKLDGVPIAGADGQAHHVDPAEQGHALSCQVTASNSAGAAPAAESAAVTVTEAPPANLSSPLIAGDARVGATLTCDPGTWLGARSYSYLWMRDGTALDAQAGPTHVAISKDVGHELRCLVTARNFGGSAVALSAGVVAVPAPHTAGFARQQSSAGIAANASGASSARTDIRSVRLSGNTLVIRVAVPAAGRVDLALATAGTKPATLARHTSRPSRKATISIKLHLGRTALSRLRTAGKTGLKVAITATFRPRTGGAAQRDKTTVTLHAGRR
jgi:hypothetical protein